MRAWYRLTGDDLIDVAVSHDNPMTTALREGTAALSYEPTGAR
ncbi:hypothetical protein OG871_36395 [Kitasatospora sp. NBC_00374]